MAKRRVKPDPYLADVTDWPHQVSGKTEVLWCSGDAINATETPSSLSVGLADGNGGVVFSFGIDGALLDRKGISVAELDEGIRILVEVEPEDGLYSPVAEHGKLIHYQCYVARTIVRVDETQA